MFFQERKGEITMSRDNSLYYVRHITESDYGCEETENAGDKAAVRLVDHQGKSRWIETSDRGLADRDINEGDIVRITEDGEPELVFHTRTAKPSDGPEVAAIERICFPPNEACKDENMKERTKKAAGYFLVAEAPQAYPARGISDKGFGSGEDRALIRNIAGMINGIATDEDRFRDEFFTDLTLHHDGASRVMICGVEVLPEYRGMGLAGVMMQIYKDLCSRQGAEKLYLTNHDRLTPFYEELGFRSLGTSASVWGGTPWNEMVCDINTL